MFSSRQHTEVFTMDNKTESTAASTTKRFPIKRIVISLLAGLASFLLFWAIYFCVSNRPTEEMGEYAGTYTIISSASDDITLDSTAADIDISLALYSGGKCTLSTDGNSRSGIWTLKNNNVTIYCNMIKLQGKITGNRLTLYSPFNAGHELAFALNNPDAQDAQAPTGTYILTSMEDNGTVYAKSVLDSLGYGNWFISFDNAESGSARIFSDSADEISIGENCIIMRAVRYPYSIEDDILTLFYADNITLTFAKG